MRKRSLFREVWLELQYQTKLLKKCWCKAQRFHFLIYGLLVCLALLLCQWLMPLFSDEHEQGLSWLISAILVWSYLAWAVFRLLPWIYRKKTCNFPIGGYEGYLCKAMVVFSMPFILFFATLFVAMGAMFIVPGSKVETMIWGLLLVIMRPAFVTLFLGIFIGLGVILWVGVVWLYDKTSYLAVRLYHRAIRRRPKSLN